ncbi:MAG TPA: aspartyl protease family protein [Thermoanaerobaculia bacterium]|nr:aspartyl protease family protein [Thermoanaerobaculia bacterium]
MRRTILLLLAALSLQAREVARVPAEIRGNRVVVDVEVNDLPPSKFILDTGAASTVVEKSYAAARGLRSTGQMQAQGAAGSVNVGVAENLVFEVGGDVRVPAARVALIPMEPILLRAGSPVDGVLGREVFNAYVVEIDYERSAVAFHERKSFTSTGVRVPLQFVHGSIPQVDVRLTLPDGRTVPARLHLDTGAGPGLILTRSFVKRHHIEMPDGIDTALGLGVGGATTERTGRIGKLEFAGFTFDKPVAMLSNSMKGLLGNAEVDGILGGEILRRFTLQIDYGRKELYLTRNANFGEPIEIDMLGATLAASDTSFRSIVVQSLIPKTAAVEAGLREGDELRAIDGRAVTPRELDSVRRMFRKPDQRYELTIARGGKELIIRVKTRRVV